MKKYNPKKVLPDHDVDVLVYFDPHWMHNLGWSVAKYDEVNSQWLDGWSDEPISLSDGIDILFWVDLKELEDELS